MRELVEGWRDRATVMESHGAAQAAQTLQACARELERALRSRATEVLTVAQAAEETGRHPETVRRWLREGTVPNVGRKGSPKVRRCDLPGVTFAPCHANGDAAATAAR